MWERETSIGDRVNCQIQTKEGESQLMKVLIPKGFGDLYGDQKGSIADRW